MIDSMHTGDHALQPDLSIVVPVYRSEDCLEALIEAVAEALNPTNRDYEVVLVNDCSPDNSWAVIEAICRSNHQVVGVDLRRNFGQDAISRRSWTRSKRAPTLFTQTSV